MPLVILLITCRPIKHPPMKNLSFNHLKGESSLYLQQHAQNPVDWYPWSTAAFDKAKNENKLVLVSIGYSSCHWCHVMEKESFMDSATAKLMNDHFVCIKVDREERPDIDQIYMKAVQLMTGSGGWPLNCFTLPDGKPIYGGTYFQNKTWKDLLEKINKFYHDEPKQAEKYADELIKGISQPEIISKPSDENGLKAETVSETVSQWKKYFDTVEGGPNRSPKFPLPNNYQFLLRYAKEKKDKQLNDYVQLTLKKMAYGGIYDQIGGGFARYSTDTLWKVPHFEKMLYDNAQLISLYSQAYQAHPNDLYKQIVYETTTFLKREMSDGSGKYFSALDADSEGEEGKFYSWTKKELAMISFPPLKNGKEKEIIYDYFNINESGYWEKDQYILLRNQDNDQLAAKYGMTTVDFENYIQKVKEILLDIRNKRIHPGLDEKVVTSWNSLQIKALCDAYKSFGDIVFLNDALTCMNQLKKNAFDSSGNLLHVESQKGKLKSGYLEDYAFTITAMISLYQCTFNEEWLNEAHRLSEGAIEHFYDKENGMFWFNSNLENNLVSRTKEISDNVIPASNSEMAHALFFLSEYFEIPSYEKMAREMVSKISNDMPKYGSGYSNWANLLMNFTFNYKEVVIVGPDAEQLRKTIASQYMPNVLIAGSVSNSSKLPLLTNRFIAGKTLIYVCENKTCKLPVETSQEALKLIGQ